MFDTCTLAVLAEMNSSPAMSRLLCPAATRRSTSNSRAVSPSRSGSLSGPAAGLSSSGILARRASSGDAVVQRPGAQILGQRGGPAQPGRAAVPVARGQRGLGRLLQGRASG